MFRQLVELDAHTAVYALTEGIKLLGSVPSRAVASLLTPTDIAESLIDEDARIREKAIASLS